MLGKDLTLIAGVFLNETSAQQAMSDLQQAGFTDDQILYSVHKGGAGILDSLLGLGFGQDEAAYYNSEFMAGHTVVTVMNTDRQQEAYDILQRNGAFDAASRIGPSATDYASTDIDVDTDQKIRLHEEQLSATKQWVQAGEIGIHKEIITEEKTLNVPVSHEEVYIERRPVSDIASHSEEPFDFSRQEGIIRVPVSEEQVQVIKQPVVIEEITVGKRVVQENQQITDTVRREEAHIERSGDVNIQGADVVNDVQTRIDQ